MFRNSTAAIQSQANLHQKNVEKLLEKLEWADAICVGGASGMSAAAGYIWYADDALFRKYFGAFAEKYGIDSIFNGFYYRYRTPEERWAYIATLIHYVMDCCVGQPYKDLHTLLNGQDYFIATTNQDTQFAREFGEDLVGYIQGDWRFFQCAHRCHDAVYPATEYAEKMYRAIRDCRVPTEMIPRCPHCGQFMEPWVRGYSFLEGAKYKEQYEKWNSFLTKNKDKKLLFLELGVGRMTPMFIQEPFWNMTYSLPDAYYITINPKDAALPRELREKGYAIHEDIAAVLADAVKYKQGRQQA